MTTPRSRLERCFLLLVVAVAFVGCDKSKSGDSNKKNVCLLNETQKCFCKDGTFGVQECTSELDGWTVCECIHERDTGCAVDPDSDSNTDADVDSDTDTAPIPCWQGVCCDVTSQLTWPSVKECKKWTEIRCQGDACGDNAQRRTTIQYCSGASTSCNGTVFFGTWTTIDDCDSVNEYCETDGSTYAKCIACTHGCGEGACYPECNPADACCSSTGTFLSSAEPCVTWNEYRCSSTDCGGDPERRTVVQYCTGNDIGCYGNVSPGSWFATDDCDPESQFCEIDSDSGARCHSCHFACSDGACSDQCLSSLVWDGNFVIEDSDDLSEISGFTQISGNLTIDGTTLDNVDNLYCLTSVEGEFHIENNTALTSLAGLSALSSVGNGFYIRYNSLLQNLNGLDNFVSADYGLYIMGNDQLSSLIGFGSLEYVGYYFNISSNNNLLTLGALTSLSAVDGTLYLYHNNSLSNLAGLENITTISGEILISNHAALSSLSGLTAQPGFKKNLYIQDNTVLPTCAAEALRDQFINDGWAGNSYISGNDDGGTCN